MSVRQFVKLATDKSRGTQPNNGTTTIQVRSVWNKMIKTIGLMLAPDGIPSGPNPLNTHALPY